MDKKTIDITPTWVWTVKTCIEVIRNGTAEGVKQAEKELYRLAENMDKINDNNKAIRRNMFEGELKEIEQNYNMGLYTPEERETQIQSVHSKYRGKL